MMKKIVIILIEIVFIISAYANILQSNAAAKQITKTEVTGLYKGTIDSKAGDAKQRLKT